ncbi:DMT family transporter [Singulisphaera sp. GP187]|uniref:DMT family transporter n=1 Tax=Singulisphaera sp. GP187 TaxID=1882752 RepID=UPI0020B1756D|nr:DMT family transporter [Singulisphaera sp. GP187]
MLSRRRLIAMSVTEIVHGETSSDRVGELGAYVSLALMVLIGSTTATAAKYVVRELPVGLVPVIRFGCAGLCLLPVVWREGSLSRLIRNDGLRLLIGAALCVPINQSFFLNATRLAPTSHVALFYAAVPLVVLLLASALGQERLNLDRLGGVLASILGVVIIGLGNFWQGGAESRDAIWGDLLLVGAVVSWGAYMTVNKPLVAKHGALPVLAATFLLGSLLDLPIALATRPSWTAILAASPAAWRGLAFLILVSTILGLAFQNQALRRLDASQVASVGNASPILTVIWGIWLFHEAVTPTLALGGMLTLGGIVWTSRKDFNFAPQLAPADSISL